MSRTVIPPLILFSLSLLFYGGNILHVEASLQYGFYSPFPPVGGDQVVYDFSPISDDSNSFQAPQQLQPNQKRPQKQEQIKHGHRATRDLAWKEFDSFLSGEVEPSCEDLRKMWRLARQMQDQAVRTNEIRQELHPFLTYSTKSSTPVDNGSLETAGPSSDTTADDNRRKADRRRFSNPTASTTAAHRRMEENENNNNNNKASDELDSREEVYGIVRTSPPQQQQQPPQQQQPDNVVRVRDPAKEIYGLLRDRSAQARIQKPHVYGNVRTHSPVKTEQSYLDALQQKLYGKSSQEESEPSYGVVRYSVDNPSTLSQQPSSQSSSFETVRELLAANDGGGAEGVSNEEGSSFDLIRERLLNTRGRQHGATTSEQNKSLRRKNSRKRRRNAEEVAQLERQILSDYMTFARASGALEKTEKKNRRERNQKERQNRRKLRLQKEKERRKNILLKKLGRKK